MNKNNKKQNKIFILLAILIVMIMIISTYIVACGVLISYDGLGMKQEQEDSVYDMDFLKRKHGRYQYDDGFYHSKLGVDVSQFQGDIRWKEAADDGIEFAMVRLGYRLCDSGEIHLDSRFKNNLKGAKSANLDVGVYFFSQATNVDEAIEEAKFVIKNIRGKKITMPVAFDLEPVEGSDRVSSMDETERTQVADAFCQIIEKAGYKAMVYGNPSFISASYSMGYLTNYDTWLAHYAKNTSYDYKFAMWQYTDSGEVEGIDGYVDLDLYFEEY